MVLSQVALAWTVEASGFRRVIRASQSTVPGGPGRWLANKDYSERIHSGNILMAQLPEYDGFRTQQPS